MLLAIDVGNTRIKAAVFKHNTILERFVLDYADFKDGMAKILESHPALTDIVVASVGKLASVDFDSFHNRVKIHFVTHSWSFPFANAYSTPATLGIDRLVLSSGAAISYPGQNRLVIDAGTCVTYDFVDASNTYLGGAISPGIRLRYEALHNYTANLPLLTKAMPSGLIGDSTTEAIHSGVVNGLLLEIDGFINAYADGGENFIIILTGGDAEFLAKQLKNTIFANQNFLLESLNQLFQYNKNDQKN